MPIKVQAEGPSAAGIGLSTIDGHPGGASGPATLAETIQRFVIWILRVFSLPVEVFMHRRFGVRFLTFPMLILSVFVMFLYWLVLTLAANIVTEVGSVLGRLFGFRVTLEGTADDWLWPVVFIAFIIVGGVQAGITQWQNFVGVNVHSRYSGSPAGWWFSVPYLKQEYTVKRFFEPAIAAFVGWIIWFFLYQDTVAWYIWICAGAMSLRNHLEYMLLRGRLLDLIDARINAEEMHNAVYLSKQPSETRGAEIAGIVRPSAPIGDRVWAAGAFGEQQEPPKDRSQATRPAPRSPGVVQGQDAVSPSV